MFSAGALVAVSVLLFSIRRRRREGKGGQAYEPLPTTSEEEPSAKIPAVPAPSIDQSEAVVSHSPKTDALR